MSSKFRQRCLLWLVFLTWGLSIALVTNWQPTTWALGTVKPVTIVTVHHAIELEAQGKNFYQLNQFQSAVVAWEQAYQRYLQAKDVLSQGRVLSNLALAYGQLNHWQQATETINTSLDLLTTDADNLTSDRWLVLAQVQNNRGILLLQQGQTEAAIAVWQEATGIYQQTGDELGIIRVVINQANAFKELGLYRRAVNTLGNIEADLRQQPDSLIKITGLRSYGDLLGLMGEIERSQSILTVSLESALRLNNLQEVVKTQLILGHTYQNHHPSQALKTYESGLLSCQQDPSCGVTDLPLQLNLAQLNLFLELAQWQDAQTLVKPIISKFKLLPKTKINIERKINFARSLIRLQTQAELTATTSPSWGTIQAWLADVIQQAKAINDLKAQSYSWGLKGQIEEELQHWLAARQYSQQALLYAQQLNTPEVVYLWQWQLGRIEKSMGNHRQAIAHYTRAVELLKSLSQDLVAINPDVQYSFREEVEPVYRQLVSLLLARDEEEVSQVNLERGRQTIESLQLAELNNFFREACLDTQVVDIDNLDPQAAIIYPIILSDRLEVILSLPNQPLRHYQTQIAQNQLEGTIEKLRQSIVVRSRRDFYAPATQLYDLLIRPTLADLTANQIKTLVFIPDTAFRNIPLAVLYDGQQYLIENYNVALTPGLQLLTPRPLQQAANLQAIAAGLTQSRQGFSALNYVNEELQLIKTTANGVILLDREFTTESLGQKIQFSDYPIVHIATHGQFSSSLEDTFLLTWNDRLGINQLDNLLQTRNLQQEKAIELLVLSACETATGDKRAALGLAGMAVRAGAKSTLATLWSVNDRATTKIMANFYHQLSEEHLPKAQAIRQAQLSLLRDRQYAHPFYWAAYVLLGNWL